MAPYALIADGLFIGKQALKELFIDLKRKPKRFLIL